MGIFLEQKSKKREKAGVSWAIVETKNVLNKGRKDGIGECLETPASFFFFFFFVDSVEGYQAKKKGGCYAMDSV